jgi:ABC-type multidrug transport system ATPase subunit
VQVLDDASFELEAGQFGGVWGDRSSGKSTLAAVVAGVLAPEQGTITFDGHDLHGADTDRRRRARLRAQIGLATRRGPETEEWPVESWIASAMLESHTWSAALRQAHVALDRVGVGHIGGQPWSRLADGERMLVSVAHAIVRGPRLLVVDDPVAGLGALQRGEVMELLHSLAAAGVAVLMTAAELTELQGADRIWALTAGRLDGPPARPLGDVVQLRSSDASRRPR